MDPAAPSTSLASPRRRGILQGIGAAGLVALCPDVIKAAARDRWVAFHCPRLGETLRVVYWTPTEGYVPESMEEISQVFRDHYDDSAIPIDPRLIDQLFALQMALQPRMPIHITSGYRSPATNARLRRRNRRVAPNSFHMYGRAVDLRLEDIPVQRLHRAALALKAGGVGYYPRAAFIHMDTGPVRHW
ncbi:MAG: YcbK family protein [Candidatus Competibacterales bacterium]